jgi:hypothetical protein
MLGSFEGFVFKRSGSRFEVAVRPTIFFVDDSGLKFDFCVFGEIDRTDRPENAILKDGMNSFRHDFKAQLVRCVAKYPAFHSHIGPQESQVAALSPSRDSAIRIRFRNLCSPSVSPVPP